MSRRLRIALVTTSFPDRSDGSEAAGAFVADFARALGKDAAVTVIAAGREDEQIEQDGYTLRRFHCPRLPLSLLSPLNPGDWLTIWKTLSGGWRALESAHQAGPFDHVLALWTLPSGGWARRLQQRYGVPYSTWALGSDIWTLGRIPVLRQYLAAVLRDAHHRHADGLQLAEDVRAICGADCTFLPSSRTLSVPPRPSPRRTAPPYRLAFLGRWHPNKGIDLLLDALTQLDDADWSRIKRVDIGGGGPLEAAVKAAVVALVAAGRPVRLQGYLDREAATRYIQSADVLLLPSRIESIPVIFSDAMQCGTPLLATPVGDLPQLLARHHCGSLAKAASAGAYAEALIELVSGRSPPVPEASLAEAAKAFEVQSSANAFLALLVEQRVP